MDKIYNKDYCATTSTSATNVGDDPEPTPDPTPSIKSSYQFPYFDNGTDKEYPNTANQKFARLIGDFKNRYAYGGEKIAPDYADSIDADNDNTGVIRISTNYTDDNSCVFKVNMGSNAFTSLNVTYAGATSYL
jgi:hypothetical protein